MEERGTRKKRTRGTSEKESNAVLFQSFCIAVFAFLAVVLTHQLIVGVLSYVLDYDTQVTFGKVISKPYDTRNWSSNRVLAMYVAPSVFFIVAAISIAVYMLYTVKVVKGLYRFFFWVMVFSVLFVTAQFTLAPLAATIGKGSLYQGISVAAAWWGVDTFRLLIFSLLALLINIVFGFIGFRLLMQFSPLFTPGQKQVGQRDTIRYYFIYPIAMLMPVALLLAYPNSLVFFAAMLLHAILWLPGLYIKSQVGYRFEGTVAKATKISTGYLLPVVVLLMVILIRIFL